MNVHGASIQGLGINYPPTPKSQNSRSPTTPSSEHSSTRRSEKTLVSVELQGNATKTTTSASPTPKNTSKRTSSFGSSTPTASTLPSHAHAQPLLAVFELDDAIPYNLSKHLHQTFKSRIKSQEKSTKFTYLLNALVYLKAFKQVYSSVDLDDLISDVPETEIIVNGNGDKDENGDVELLSDVHEISKLAVYVPERVDMLLCGLGNFTSSRGEVKILWPRVTLLTMLVNAMYYGLMYFDEKIISRRLPNFELVSDKTQRDPTTGDVKLATQLIWNDYESYMKFQHYCKRHLAQYPAPQTMTERQQRGFHSRNPHYRVVYDAYMCGFQEWRKRIEDERDDVVGATCKILGLQFVTIQSTVLKSMSYRICRAYSSREHVEFEKIWKMKRTKGTSKGWLGQLCKNRIDDDDDGGGGGSGGFGEYEDEMFHLGERNGRTISAFPLSGFDRTFGHMLKPSKHYEILDREAALALYQDMMSRDI
ncbi:uncharacterized protein LODBEIA_P54500 [Lodderomyces beijingensis]|uniref:Uncharacterized protein n=1 Tax=Lodderomyces beijingensis TaxID=1775926 RepID=A0ABP0ZVE9_9ASCO